MIKTTNGTLLSVVEFAAVDRPLRGPTRLEGNGMNWELIKHKFCRLAVTASLLLGGVMVAAATSGTMPLGLRCWDFAAVACSTQSAASCWAPRQRSRGGRLPAPAAPPYNCALCAAGTLPESAYPYLL